MVAVSMRGAKKLQDELESFALSLPEAWFDTPWDEDRVTKVRKQIFAFYGNQDAPSIGVRLIDSLDEAMSLPGASAMSYDMGVERQYIASVQERMFVWHIYERLN